MSQYPNTNSDNFYKKITKLFRKYQIKDSNPTLKEVCYPKKFNLKRFNRVKYKFS